MVKEVLLPDLGEGIDGADVSEVVVSVGDTVSKEDTLLVLESDKASMEIPAEDTGVIKEILVSPGDSLETGALLMRVEVKTSPNESSLEEKPSLVKEEVFQDRQSVAKKETYQEKPPSSSGGLFASPGVRRLARELEIDLSVIRGTGRKGRTTKQDLHSHIKLRMSTGSTVVSSARKEIDFSRWGEIEKQKLTKINKITASRLQDAWQEIPHVTQYDDADITGLEAFRKKLKVSGAKEGVKVTFLPFLLRAVSVVLKEMPRFNSSLDHEAENLILKKYINVGVAVDTPAGLVVPSIRDVANKTIFQLSKELMDISARAKEKKLKPDELTGSTFTISSLGGIGGARFSPIVNPPEVAILGVSKSKWSPVYYKETRSFEPRYLMPFCVSYDHRVIDGAAGASFTTRLASVLSNEKHFED
ncbi:MAG: 2-oxo acid dehydrogenase subunit E2 [Candidatus Neomarinimicrobiota bacterium]